MTAVTAVAATALTVVPSPAHASEPQAAASGTWRVSLRTSAGTGAAPVVATGKKTAWTFVANEPGNKVRAFHLSGGKWRSYALPRTANGPVIEAAASSDRNVWAATLGLPMTMASADRLRTGRPDLSAAAASGKAGPARILRWNGHAWTTMKSLPATLVTAIAVAGPHDVRVFGTLPAKMDARPVVWRYNGKTWKRTTPKTMVTSVAVRSSRDIWAAGFDNSGNGHERVLHFDGRSWKNERLPLPSGGVFFSGIAADRDRVWVTGDDAEGPNGRAYAFVRDRRGWHRERIPGASHLGPVSRPFLTDRGEVMFMTMPVGDEVPPAYRERMIMFHRKNTGKWHVDVVPEKLAGRGFAAWEDVAPLRGTGTVLVGGSLDDSPTSDAAVAVYRPDR
ncbi:hypothetical protein [Actinomadura harenae]|uniref:WD40 repeat domain-containing protein n=1 Tax=Actinomadura harenae TaxID=2483351 RepID=A0A3M2MGH5_9ACTN|nr:hypothetical protein [Actinomadura harenae]RMI47765.1 hypothetical protein EBO15_00170 [Actinomadura harenae]